jgi:hypothetical protein
VDYFDIGPVKLALRLTVATVIAAVSYCWHQERINKIHHHTNKANKKQVSSGDSDRISGVGIKMQQVHRQYQY